MPDAGSLPKIVEIGFKMGLALLECQRMDALARVLRGHRLPESNESGP